jgi:hypothetical protein
MNNLRAPTIIETEHRMIPVIAPVLLSRVARRVAPANAIMLTINPPAAKGILIQFNAPRQGKNPTIIPTKARIPSVMLKVCIEDVYF